MTSRKWRLGFGIAVLFGMLNAGAGLAGDMGWKSFVAVLCTSLLTNLTAYLMKHPLEEVKDDTSFTAKTLLVAILIPLLCSGCMNGPAMVRALSKDNATVSVRVSTIYGSGTFLRTMPGTNGVQISPDGTMTVLK